MSAVVIIPSRLNSKRFPEKAMHSINGVPMIVHVWKQACNAKCGDVVVATPDDAIAECITNAGGEAILTDPSHPTGSDRVFEAFIRSRKDCSVIVNLQGDLPIFPPEVLRPCVEFLEREDQWDMVTLVQEITQDEAQNPQVVKTGWSFDVDALENWGKIWYFSRAPLIGRFHNRSGFLKHIGAYFYRPRALKDWCRQPVSPLEEAEDIEALRSLQMGWNIAGYCVHPSRKFCSVDVPDDIKNVTRIKEFLPKYHGI